jgi:hypothetical protein
MGMTSLLPGMQYMFERVQECMQNELNEFRREIEALQNGAAAPVATGKNGWPDDPEERRREMKRRMAVRNAKATGKIPTVKIPGLHPRDPAHPGHDVWLKKLRRIQKRKWNSMTPAEQKERLDRMRGARKAA